MSSLRTTAKSLGMLLDFELLDVGRVIAWVDEMILAMDDPPIALIEASLLGRDVNALVSALRDLPGEICHDEALRLTFLHMRELLAEDAEIAPRVARALFRMAMEDQAPEEGESVMPVVPFCRLVVDELKRVLDLVRDAGSCWC